MKNKQLWSLMIRICAVSAVVAMTVSFSWATGYTRIYSFTGGTDGRDPATALTFDSSGNAYGTTAAGGDFDLGAVFKLTPLGGGVWAETVIYSFTGGNDGSDPHGGVTLGADGNLYGTAVAGGSGGFCTGDGCGVVYKLTPAGDQWFETTLYSFKGGTDGWGPGGRVVFDAAGNLFGTTPNGGRNSFGTVFKLTPANGAWSERIIHSFTGGKDGATGSLGDLIFDAAGNVYGVAEQGGANGAGTVYKLFHSPTGGWILTTLYAFKGMPDAAFPFGGLIFDSAGNLYGTTYFGGAAGMGTVFQLAPGPNGKWQENILYNFLGGTDGSLPTSTLIFDARGRLFGTTSTGGRPTCDCGTVFRLTLFGGSWNERIVHLFGRGSDGYAPNYGLTFDAAGNLFGATPAGGTSRVGTIFMFTP